MTKAAEIIRQHVENPKIHIAMILGSGLSDLADAVDGVKIDYADLPGFPKAGVSGHSAALAIGKLFGADVAVLGGREHYYEHGRADAMREPLETMAALGAQILIATNACGSFRPDLPPGDLMLISDHINYSGLNPLIGEPTDRRFVNMTEAYDPDLRAALKSASVSEAINLKEGIYSWYSGPSFETPAEIRMLKMLGADVVGMSTVPEVILGRFLGLRCAGVSVITNMAAGLGNEHISHEHTKESAPVGAAKLRAILERVLPEL